MGDTRFQGALDRVEGAVAATGGLCGAADGDLIESMAADSRRPYLANVAATELRNRLGVKNAILEVAAEGLCALDGEGRVAFLNPAAEALLGLRPGQARGRPFHALVHGEEPTGAFCPLSVALGSTRAVRVEEDAFLSSDGSSFPAAYTVAPICRDTKPEGHVAVFRDASASRGAIAALEESEARLAAALRLAGVGRWDWDARNDIMVLGDEAYGILGLRPERFGGHLGAFLGGTHAEDRPRLAGEMARACQTGSDFSVRHRLRHPGEAGAVVRTRGRFVFDAAGRAVAAWGTVQGAAAARMAPSPFEVEVDYGTPTCQEASQE